MKGDFHAIDERELQWEFFHSSGPGGQNVNKVATAVQLRFDVMNSATLPEEVRKRLAFLAGHRLTQDGILIIEAKRQRTQEQNREDALKRFYELLRQAYEKPKARHRTKPTLASRQKRLAGKRRKSDIKRLRGERLHSSDN